MEGIFLKLLNMSVAAGWMILAVAAVRIFLKKAPKWISCALWGIVAIRLVCPFSPESSFSLIPSRELLSSETVRFAREPAIDSGIPYLDEAVNPVFSSSFAPAPGASVNPLQVWMLLAGILWGIGLAGMAVYALIGVWRVRRKVREAVFWQENIWICDRVASPFILGIVKPRIYLPSGMEAGQRDYVLAHERAHLTRRDHWWKALGYLLLAVYWFHPLVWAAYVLFSRDLELSCDEKVIRAMDLEERKAYSRALVACSMAKGTMPACPLAFGEVGVKERVKKVLHYKRPGFWLVVGAAGVCILMAVCFLTNPKQGGGETKAAMDAGGETEAAMDAGGETEAVRDADGQAKAAGNADGQEIVQDVIGMVLDANEEVQEADFTYTDYKEYLASAIRSAILEENKSVYDTSFDVACCDFVCLEMAPRISETDGVSIIITYYGWAMYEAYQVSEEGLVCAEGSYLPVALTFEEEEENFRLMEYWKPREGGYFVPDVREKFPARVAEAAIDSQKYMLLQKQSCYQQAVAYSGLNTDVVIGGLLDEICGEPSASSNPQDYIDAHIREYQELLFYGDYLLEYEKTHVREQKETDLASVILSLACEEITRQEKPVNFPF